MTSDALFIPTEPLDLDRLEAVGLLAPNVEVPTTHRFGPGVYIREALMPPGVIVGRIHKTHCTNIMVSGCLSLRTEQGLVTLRAPMCFPSGPGRKVAVVHEPTIWLNIFATTETDLAKLDAMLFEDTPYVHEWRDAVMRFATIQAARDREDFAAFVASSGWTADEVRSLSEVETDQMPMPAPWSQTLHVLPSPIEGQGLFTTSPIKAGSVIAPARLDGKRTPAGRYINHAKAPNAAMERCGNGDVVVVALRDIAGCHGGDTGEEITVDYRAAVDVGRQP